ncbi:MlaD family protein [Amycolatopsis sp.]|uniref:MlaD family protein n=1 Tax=Amycolatopsis sp. TaxID=37632 RepID=UPI002DF76C04|nr:MlaD family protein [Amycolatopsis sp.]
MTRTMTGAARTSRRHFRLGLVLFAVIALAAVVVLDKSSLATFFTPGETITAQFPRNLELQVGGSDVKIAGTRVGTVSSVETTTDSITVVSMKVDNGTRAKLGTDPGGAIRPVTVLGGRYYIALSPGGGGGEYRGDLIPLARTTAPVELPEVFSALQPSARQGLRKTVGDLDGALSAGGSDALRSLLQDAPGTLSPTGDVLKSALGNNPGADLPQLVGNLDQLANVLTRQDGQLASVLEKLHGTTSAINAGSKQLGAAVADLPETLRASRAGMTDLGGTLDKLKAVSPGARPGVQSLNEALDHLDPALAAARPVVADLRPLLAEARPLVDELVPTSQLATSVLDDVRGPALDRLNGPIIAQLNTQWRGTGPFAGGGANGHTVYQELGILAARFDNLSKHYDQNGAFANLQAGVGTNTLAGIPGLDRFLLDLTKIGGAPK